MGPGGVDIVEVVAGVAFMWIRRQDQGRVQSDEAGHRGWDLGYKSLVLKYLHTHYTIFTPPPQPPIY